MADSESSLMIDIPDIPIMLAESYYNKSGKADYNCQGWYASEKIDGFRCIFVECNLYTRSGRVIPVPSWFKDILIQSAHDLIKPIVLDGELHFGRGNFARCASFNSHTIDPDVFKHAKYLIFDLPLSKDVYEQRIKVLQALQSRITDYIRTHDSLIEKRLRSEDLNMYMNTFQIPEFTIIDTTEMINTMLKKIESIKGEGLILHAPDNLYINGRSRSYLKVKSIDDHDAIVLGYNEGKGKLAGLLGSLIVAPLITDSSTHKSKPDLKRQFNISGLCMQMRQKTYYTKFLKPGTVICYYHNNYCDDLSAKDGMRKPRFPRFHRIKHVHEYESMSICTTSITTD